MHDSDNISDAKVVEELILNTHEDTLEPTLLGSNWILTSISFFNVAYLAQSEILVLEHLGLAPK